jgi:predicted dehydrogenase
MSNSPNEYFRVAIIGAGDMGATHARSWLARGDVRIVAVCDPDQGRATALADAHGVPAFGDYREAIEKTRPDIVSVCVPVNLHRPVAEAAFEFGCHALIEKPIAGSLEDARAIQRAAHDSGRKLVVGYQYRGLPGWKTMKRLLDEGLAVDRLFFRCMDVREVRPKLAMHHKSMNGGPIVDMCGHLFDLARYYFGAEPLTVYAKGHVYGAGRPRLATVHDPAVDAAEITVNFENGHTLSVYVNWGMPEGFPATLRAEIFSPDYYASIDGSGVTVTTSSGIATHAEKSISDGPSCRMEDLIQSIRSGGEPEVSAGVAIKALEVSLAAVESIETGREISVAEISGRV